MILRSKKGEMILIPTYVKISFINEFSIFKMSGSFRLFRHWTLYVTNDTSSFGAIFLLATAVFEVFACLMLCISPKV